MSQTQRPTPDIIDEARIEEICTRLTQDKKLRETLPGDGWLHIDRHLPFLCVYRRPADRPDVGTEQFVTAQASYLIASGEPRQASGLVTLIKNIVKTAVDEFGTFLIIEIWSAPDEAEQPQNIAPSLGSPAFRLVASKTRPPTEAIEALEEALQNIHILSHISDIAVDHRRNRSPQGMPPLILAAKAKRLNCFILGLEVRPIYRNPVSGEIFPLLLRTLRRSVDRALKQAIFEFLRVQTTHQPENYLALGQQAVDETVLQIDQQLADISNAFDFLLQVTPVNIDRAWAKFKESNFETPPLFYYRPRPMDPALLKRKLYDIPLERIEDPTLAFIFREKRTELDRQLSMLEDRGTQQFLYGSLQLFGRVEGELLELAETLLAMLPSKSSKKSAETPFDAEAFAQRAKAELDYYRRRYPPMTAQVEIRDDVIGLLVSRGNLLIGHTASIAPERVEALLQHEIGTHVLTYFNGQAQPFQQLYAGLAGYEELQEGLAVLAEYLVGGLSYPRLRLLAGRVVAAHCLIVGASFIDTFGALYHTHGFTPRQAFSIATRIYRGGGLTKDAVYLRGLAEILRYLQQGGQLEPLFVGKIAATHVTVIQELQWRRVLKPAPLRPRYMEDNPHVAARIERLRQGVGILDMI